MTRGLTPHLLIVLIATAALLLPGMLAAQFTPPLQLTPGDGGYHDAAMIRAAGDRISVARERNGDIHYTTSDAGFPAASPVDPSPLAQSHGRLAAGPLFLQFLVYQQEDTGPGAAGNEIVLIDNNGGVFAQPQLITDNIDVDDRNPVASLGSSGELDIAWESEPLGGPAEILLKRGDGAPILVAEGSRPQMAQISGGGCLVAYERAGTIFGRVHSGGGLLPEQTIADMPGGCQGLALAADGNGAAHAVFVNGGSLYFTSNEEGNGFASPLFLDAGPVAGDPKIAAEGDAHIGVVLERGGEILWLERLAGSFGGAQSLPSATTGSSQPAVAFDSHGYLHVCYAQGGEVFYVNNVPPPVAAFSASGTSGELPLATTFLGESQGIITSYLWDFGDGETSTAESPIHSYLDPGTYSVTLTVTGPGGEDSVTDFNAINAELPPNYVFLADIPVYAGEPIFHPVIATHTDPLQGFQLAIVYDDANTPISEVSFAGTQVEALFPEFVVVQTTPNGAESELIVAVILDTQAPFDGRTIPPGIGQVFATLNYTVTFPLPMGLVSHFTFTDSLGDPPISNIFSTSDIVSVTPYFLHGSITVSEQPQFLFFRGDANYNQAVDIADAIFQLTFLFAGGSFPPCPDSADANDDGALDIGDPIFVLAFLFNNGETLPYPYPGMGLDPTEDTLGPCLP
ncbi:MAG: PKD domain-containing protein [Planctomycetota bacterium]